MKSGPARRTGMSRSRSAIFRRRKVTMIGEVLMNLLANAVKFAKTYQAAQIEVGADRRAGENVYFVKDKSIGFDQAYAGKLFGLFERLHGQTEYEGAGVGLAIVKQAVERHGGRVWAEGAKGEGATFYFSLPRREEMRRAA